MRRLDGQPPAPKGYGERAAYAHAYYLKNNRRYKKYREEQRERRREVAMLRLYGIGTDQFSRLLQAQSNTCAICHLNFDPTRKETMPHVDHLHEKGKPARTGSVRGILCNKCNKGLGMFNDSPGLFEAAIAYLAAPPAYVVLGEPLEQPVLHLVEGEGA